MSWFLPPSFQSRLRGSHDPSQYSDDVFTQWCMKFSQIKTFVLPHWLIIWQIGGPLCVDTEEAPHPHSIKRPLAEKRKKFLYSRPFLFFVRRLHFFSTFSSDKMGRTVGFLWEGSGGAQGAGTAVSGSLKRFSQAEIFNLLRENKAEKKRKQRTKRS